MKKCVAVLAMAVVTLTGCASFDASAYLKAILDNSYKNDSTAFVEQKVGTKEEAAELYQQGIDANMNQLTGYTMDDGCIYGGHRGKDDRDYPEGDER